MAAPTTNDPLQAYCAAFESGEADGASCSPRLMARKSGRALEILGHSIEYLADEYVLDDSSSCAKGGMLEAIQILMALNREIYFSRPRTPTVMQRLRSLMGMR